MSWAGIWMICANPWPSWASGSVMRSAMPWAARSPGRCVRPSAHCFPARKPCRCGLRRRGISPGWGSTYGSERSPYADEDSAWPSEWPDHDRYEDERPVATAPAAASGPLRWARALAVGFQATAWWLRRKTRNAPICATLSLGLLLAVAAYWAGAALSSTVLSLLALAETPHATTSGWSR